MEPLQTWWATELYPSKDEDTFGVAGDFEVVRAADAQAAIAALQERVNGLEKDSELLRQSRDDFRVKYESVKNDAITLQSQLTQRTAELEAMKGELVEATHNVNVYQSLYSTSCMDRALLENELRDLRALIMAYAEAKTDFDDKRLQEDHYAWKERYNKLVEAENALLQHRQGMEG